jgi:4'-phosphopantetheinyl transferase
MSSIDVEVPRLVPDQCQVWWASSAVAGRHLRDILDASEQERLARFRVSGAAAGYLVAHATVRRVLASLTGVPASELRFEATCALCGGPHGKPRLAGFPYEFSLSHAGDVAVVAVALGVPVGMDVESAPARVAGIALSTVERDALDALPAARRGEAFARYWTRKEAVLKATGLGIATDLAALTVSAPDDPPAVLDWTWPDPIHLADVPASPGYVAALASLGSPVTVAAFDADPLLNPVPGHG